jgi:hypothetical protein
VGWLGSGGSYTGGRSYIRREVVLRERHEEGDKLVRVILNARETLTGKTENGTIRWVLPRFLFAWRDTRHAHEVGDRSAVPPGEHQRFSFTNAQLLDYTGK